MSATGADLRRLDWRKTQHSMGNGECVEVVSAEGRIAVRDSKNPDGFVLNYSSTAWQSFLKECKQR